MYVNNLLAAASPLRFTFDGEAVAKAGEGIRPTPNKREALFLAEKMRVDYVFNTAALEGNAFTYPEVKTLIEGVTVGGKKQSDADQVLNLNRALSRLIELVETNHFVVNKETACELQRLVAREEAPTWGRFRNGGVFIGNTEYVPPNAGELDAIFEKGRVHLETIVDPILRAFLIFLWGSLCQFFHDGNKRTSRFMGNGVLLSAGHPPLMLMAADQLIYNQTMNEFYDTQDATKALVWLYGVYRNRLTKLGMLEERK